MKKEKLREKVNSSSIQKLFEFVDKIGNPGSCQVTLPAERFSYIITRRVAENLLVKHGDNLPFDIMTPPASGDDNWVRVSANNMSDGKLSKEVTDLEIWLHLNSN